MSLIDEVLCLDGSRYRLHKYSSEEEVHDIVREHYVDLFGAGSIYFGFEPKLRSEAGIGSKPDGCVLIFSPPPCWIVVEVELASHPLYDHVIPQISKFIRALENPQNRKHIADALFREIESDPFKRALLEKHGFGREIYKFLNDVISKKPSITIVIDEWSKELNEVLGVLPLKANVIELKTFEREGVGLSVHAHLIKFERKEVKEEEKHPERPEHKRSWESRLKWVNPEVRELTLSLIRRIEEIFPGVTHKPSHIWYYFYKEGGRKLDSLFAVLLIDKRKVNVRIKADPSSFQDPQGWTKKYKGWFFTKKHEEREFSITAQEQLNYAIELIKQSYDISQK
jgi:predicted transport protein